MASQILNYQIIKSVIDGTKGTTKRAEIHKSFPDKEKTGLEGFTRVSREIERSTTCGEEHVQASPAQTVVKRYQMGLGRSCCPQAFTPLLDGHMTFPEAENTIHPLSNQMRPVSPSGFSAYGNLVCPWKRRFHIDTITFMKFYKKASSSNV
ncbi:hypothetical protein MJT46_000539 [Ovis ammon polii x Ovis aries]|nr:hypothetical protein MJT46_000539 [Ovis ammon polii x Ovis aries]